MKRNRHPFYVAVSSIVLLWNVSHAAIVDWRTGQTIAGTADIVPGPGVDLSRRTLRYAQLSSVDLTSANFESSKLSNARFDDSQLSAANLKAIVAENATLVNADLTGANLRFADLSGSNLTNANLTGANLDGVTLTKALLAGANFTDTNLGSTRLREVTQGGFEAAQFYATSSYKNRNITGLSLFGNDLSGWNLSHLSAIDIDLRNTNLAGADLRGTNLARATLEGANLTGARLKGAELSGVQITADQFYSTFEYETNDLVGLRMSQSVRNGWSFANSDLSQSHLRHSVFENANFSQTDFTGADLFGMVATNASWFGATLSNANMQSAWLAGTTSHGLTPSQFYSTASYQAGTLGPYMNLSRNDLTGWQLNDQQIETSSFIDSDLNQANLSGANLSGSNFDIARLRGANIQNANLTGATLQWADLTGADMSGANLQRSQLNGSNLADANLQRADLRGAMVRDANMGSAILKNAILTDGTIDHLRLVNDEQLVIRDLDIPVSIQHEFSLRDHSVLTLRLEDQDWKSLLVVSGDATVDIGAGTLAIEFATGTSTKEMLGHTFPLLAWNRELPALVAFANVTTPPATHWDLSNLYTQGSVRLLAAPVEIDAWYDAFRTGSMDAKWDYNSDGQIDLSDRDLWLIRQVTSFGDANLDGQFNADDLVRLFQIGQYEDELVENSIWASGDWNGDREFTSGDLVIAFQTALYEAQPSAIPVAVPEPMSWIGLPVWALFVRRGNRERSVALGCSPDRR